MPRKPEWTLIAATIAAVLDWLVGFGFHNLSANQAAAIMAVISAIVGAVVAWRTVPRSPQAFVYLVTALVALGTAYGMHFSQERVASFTTAAVLLLGLIVRWQVSPVEAVDPRVLGQPGTAVPPLAARTP